MCFQYKNCYFTAAIQNFLRPYNFLGLLGVVFTLISFLVVSSTIYIHIHDTYYIIGYKHFFWLIALITLLFAFLYGITNNLLLSKYLTWLHIIITTLSFITVIAFVSLGNDPNRRYIDVKLWSAFNRFNVISIFISWAILVLLFVQVVFAINVVGGVIKKVGSR